MQRNPAPERDRWTFYVPSMMIEFRREGIPAVSQSAIKAFYEYEVVGEYYADILLDEKVIVEIKAAKALGEENEAQVLNYLKATHIEAGLLLTFGPKPEVRRKAFDNSRKYFSADICENLLPDEKKG